MRSPGIHTSASSEPSASAGDALDGGAPEAAGSALPLRKRQQKVPLNTYVRPGTQQRVEVLKGRGYAVTDILDAALDEFFGPCRGCPSPSSSDPPSLASVSRPASSYWPVCAVGWWPVQARP
ncbi:hypothetical protein [Mycobacteroides abscessus]|uniref:hypothetical protein n=1 Tax=Mycobacteroides abscessus TaxID=36809 RepID=UPI001F17CB14|nr:hypothetical protein [Mycobacteroides abscessus]